MFTITHLATKFVPLLNIAFYFSDMSDIDIFARGRAADEEYDNLAEFWIQATLCYRECEIVHHSIMISIPE